MNQKTLNKCMVIVILAVFTFLGLYTTKNQFESSNEVISEEEVILPEEVPDISQGFGVYDNVIDCYLASMAVMEKQVNYKRNVNGTIVAKASFITVKQKIVSEVKVDAAGDMYFEEVTKAESSYSESVGIKAYQQKGSSTINVMKTNKVNSNYEATFTGDYEEKTIEQYENEFGPMPLDNVHIISSATLKKVNNFEFDGEEYKFAIELKTTAPRASYKSKIKRSANASSISFKMCKCEGVIDKNGLLQSIIITEKYTLNIGINADVSSTLKIEYNYN